MTASAIPRAEPPFGRILRREPQDAAVAVRGDGIVRRGGHDERHAVVDVGLERGVRDPAAEMADDAHDRRVVAGELRVDDPRREQILIVEGAHQEHLSSSPRSRLVSSIAARTPLPSCSPSRIAIAGERRDDADRHRCRPAACRRRRSRRTRPRGRRERAAASAAPLERNAPRVSATSESRERRREEEDREGHVRVKTRSLRAKTSSAERNRYAFVCQRGPDRRDARVVRGPASREEAGCREAGDHHEVHRERKTAAPLATAEARGNRADALRHVDVASPSSAYAMSKPATQSVTATKSESALAEKRRRDRDVGAERREPVDRAQHEVRAPREALAKRIDQDSERRQRKQQHAERIERDGRDEQQTRCRATPSRASRGREASVRQRAVRGARDCVRRYRDRSRRFAAIAAVRAPRTASVIQTNCHGVGKPRAARTAPVYANGSAKSVCSMRISLQNRVARGAAAFRRGSRSLGARLRARERRSHERAR